MRTDKLRWKKALAVMLVTAVLSLGVALTPGVAQSSDPDNQEHHFGGRYIVKLGIDLGKTLISPVHWDAADLLWFGGTAAITVGLMASMDSPIRDYVLKHQTTSKQNVSLFVTHLGEAPFLLGLGGVLYLGGEAFRSDSLRETGLLSVESYAIAGVIVSVMKVVAGRTRPSSGLDQWNYKPFSFQNAHHSFPSGHAISAWAVATVIAGESHSLWVGAGSYALASLVALSRITNNEHWFSDVFFGSVMGYAVGREVLALNRPGDGSKPTLSVGPGVGGFSLSLRF